MCVQKCVHTKQKSAGTNVLTLFLLVRKMGLEPTRHRHTHLKRACLPIPALPQIAFDCKKDFSTFGGIKSSPILYLFSCAINNRSNRSYRSSSLFWLATRSQGRCSPLHMGMGGAFWAIVGEHSICSRRILRCCPLPRADIESAPTYQKIDGSCVVGALCAPVQLNDSARFHGRTLFAPTAHVWLCVGGGVPDAPGKSRYDA